MCKLFEKVSYTHIQTIQLVEDSRSSNGSLENFNTTQTTNVRISEDVQLIDEDQPQHILNELKQKESLLHTARETIKSKIGVLASSIPDNNTLIKNRRLEDCAELLEYIIHKVQRVTIIYMRSNTKKNQQGKAGKC